MLQVRVRRYRCPDCRSVWRQDTSAAAEPRAVLSRHAALWALKGVVIDRLSVARIAAGLAVAWNTANDAILATGQELPPPTLTEVRDILMGHLAHLHAFYGEPQGVRIARKHLGWYADANGAPLRDQMLRADSPAATLALIATED